MLKFLASSWAALGAVFAFLLPLPGHAQTIINVPDELVGYYQLQMVTTFSGSPIQNTPAGSHVDVFITSFGALCVDELTLTSPQQRGGLLGKTYWDVALADLSFALETNSTTFTGIDVLSSSGTLYGRLTGVRTNNATGNCSEPPMNTGFVNNFFDLAESVFPTVFPGGNFTYNQIGSGFDVFRYYLESDVYLAVRDELVFARGGDYGDEFVQVGVLEDLLDDINTMLVPNRIPSFYRGTFKLALTEVQPFAPLPEGTELTFVLTNTGALCVGGVNLFLPQINSGATTATWRNSNGNLQYVLDLTRDDDPDDYDTNFPAGQFFMESAAGVRYGAFEGEKTSLSTECADAAGTDPDLSRINELFGLVETQYPAVFPKGPQTYNLRADGFTYRYYFNSKVFLAVKNGMVYLNGGEFGTHEEPVAYGTLSNVLGQLNNTPVIATVPASAFGTYAMSFGSATPFSPFVNGTAVTVVLGSGGALCLDGVAMGQPFARQSTPSLAIWENADTGVRFSLDLSALSTTSMTLDVNSTAGLDFSELTGNRTSLSTSCGTASTATNITLANQFFSLAQTHYPSQFPASLLSFNQLDGNTVRRFYPSTGLTLSITGERVSVKGGAYGPALVDVGELSALIASINAVNTPAAPIYDLTATGTGQVRLLNLSAVSRTIDEKRFNLTRPLATDTAALQAIVKDVMKDQVREFDSVTVTVATDSTTALIFTATVISNTVSAGNSTTRSYQLVITLRQR